MKAIRVHTLGDPQVLQYEETALPEPSPGEVRVRIEASGVNYIDTYQRSGLYKVPLPFTPGQEAAGIIDAVGADVTEFARGERVAYAGALGAYAEYALAPAWRVVPLPAGVTAQQAAAVMLQGMTAHYLACDTFPLKPGDTALVHAAAGGVGLLLTQIAKLRGARVIGTVSTEEKAILAKQVGADDVILYTETDFVPVVKQLTNGKGVDVVYDSVGQTTFERSLDCLRPRGYLVLYGQASGPVPPLDPQVLNAKGSLFLTRPMLAHYTASRAELVTRANDLFEWLRAGKLSVRIDRTFPLSRAADAHRALRSRATKGKLLLIP